MRRRLSLAVVVWLGICLVPLALTAAQKKEGKAPAKETRVEGNVHMIDAATKTVTVTLRPATVELRRRPSPQHRRTTSPSGCGTTARATPPRRH